MVCKAARPVPSPRSPLPPSVHFLFPPFPLARIYGILWGPIIPPEQEGCPVAYENCLDYLRLRGIFPGTVARWIT